MQGVMSSLTKRCLDEVFMGETPSMGEPTPSSAGEVGVIECFDEESGRYVVHLSVRYHSCTRTKTQLHSEGPRSEHLPQVPQVPRMEANLGS